MPDEKAQEKPYSDGILNKTNGPPGDTVHRFYEREVVRVRPSSKPRDWTKASATEGPSLREE